jgi:LPXTG-motif cell wall-anchored protein
VRSLTRRAIGAAGLGAITVALSVAGIGTAQANGQDDGNCGDSHIQLSLDGGQTWIGNGRIGDPAPTRITVRLTGEVGGDCSYAVSLASYSAEGPTWETSKTQAFLGWDTFKLTKDTPQHTLDVSGSAPTCFGQIDLYGNGNKYDGSDKDHALPHYPDSYTPTDLIAYWNGGQACTTPSPSPSDTTPVPSDTPTTPQSPTDTPSTTPASPTDTPTATPTDTVSPTTSPSDTPSSTPSDSATPTPSATTTAPVGATAAPSPSSTGKGELPTTSVIKPASVSTGSGNLAETGGNGSQTAVFAAGGAALLLVGGGAVYLTRRRNRTASR